MNLNDYELTDFSGLYISKDSHPTFGKKYIVRFQHEKKRHVKVLGYTIKDGITLKIASEMLKKFKDGVLSQIEKKSSKQEEKLTQKDKEIFKSLQEENELLKSILGDYKNLNPQVLAEGIKKIYD